MSYPSQHCLSEIKKLLKKTGYFGHLVNLLRKHAKAYFADNSIDGLLLSASGDPGLDCLIVANSNKMFPIWHVGDATNYTIVSQKRARARPLTEVPRSHLAVVGAAQKSGQLRGMFTHTGHCILVTLQTT